jgi:nucleoside-diphosphate-sugar epimerase
VTTSKILLTGGTGFLGSHVAEMLCEQGISVRATVRRTSNTRWLDPLPLEQIEADLSDPSGLTAALAGITSVVHVGGLTRATHPEAYDRVNVAGTEALAAAAGEAGVEHFIYVSSLAARGPDAASGPVSDYGRSKHGGEARLAELAAAGKAPPAIRILRPAGIYGPRDTDLLTMFQMAARGLLVLPSSVGRLQPVHVRDVASSVLRALDSADTEDPGPLPVAGAEVVGWAEVADVLRAGLERRVRVARLPAAAFTLVGAVAELGARLTGKEPVFDRRRATDLTQVTWTCDIETTKRTLNWEPVVNLHTGMVETAAWYAEHGWLTP